MAAVMLRSVSTWKGRCAGSLASVLRLSQRACFSSVKGTDFQVERLQGEAEGRYCLFWDLILFRIVLNDIAHHVYVAMIPSLQEW